MLFSKSTDKTDGFEIFQMRYRLTAHSYQSVYGRLKWNHVGIQQTHPRIIECRYSIKSSLPPSDLVSFNLDDFGKKNYQGFMPFARISSALLIDI